MQEKRARRGWYVIQVAPGAEERMCELVKRACAELDAANPTASGRETLKECFSPRFACRKRRKGTWYDVSRALLPGYVIADVRDPARLARALRSVNDYAHVLAGDKTYSPLDDAERHWIEAQSSEEDRTIPLSFGHKQPGGKIVVTSGPLEGHEAMITSYDRKSCMAHVELHAGPITFKTTVGLVVLPGGEMVQG